MNYHNASVAKEYRLANWKKMAHVSISSSLSASSYITADKEWNSVVEISALVVCCNHMTSLLLVGMSFIA